MKRILILGLAISFSSLLYAAPVYNYSGNLNRESTSLMTKDNNDEIQTTPLASEVKSNNDANNQSDKTDKSSVNDKKSSTQKENKDGNYRDMQRGRKVLEHKYNLYA